MSFHPTTTDEELEYVTKAIKELALNHNEWRKDYDINLTKGRIMSKHNDNTLRVEKYIGKCFDFSKDKKPEYFKLNQ